MTTTAQTKQIAYTTRASFMVAHRWRTVRWLHNEPNKHAAITTKAAELGATGYDTGNADHEETSRYQPYTR